MPPRHSKFSVCPVEAKTEKESRNHTGALGGSSADLFGPQAGGCLRSHCLEEVLGEPLSLPVSIPCCPLVSLLLISPSSLHQIAPLTFSKSPSLNVQGAAVLLPGADIDAAQTISPA